MYYFKNKEKIPVAALDSYQFASYKDICDGCALYFEKDDTQLVLNIYDDGICVLKNVFSVQNKLFKWEPVEINKLILSRKDKSYICRIAKSVGYDKKINFKRKTFYTE